MKKNCIGPLLMVLALLLTGCGAAPAADNAFSGWNEQVHSDMPGTGDNWNYQLSAVPYQHTYCDEEGNVLVKGSYDLPVMQVFHADGTPYDTATEAMQPAVMAAQRVNEFFTRRLAVWRQNFGEICMLADQDSEKGGACWDDEDYYYTDTVEAAFWNNSKLVCVTLRTESFTGGAQSIRSRTAVTFDIRTGREITINDMVHDYAGLRDAVALEILGQIEGGKYVKYYNGELLFDDYAQTIPEWMTRSVFFGVDSMTVVFGAYDIAAYDAGEQAFVIPYTLIEPYLNEYGRTMLEIG